MVGAYAGMVGAYHTSPARPRIALPQSMHAPTIDTHEFTRRADHASGTLPMSQLPRLVSLLLDDPGTIAWSLSGRSELGPEGARQGFLTLGCAAVVRMRCVRCLEPVEVPLEVDREYRLVASEEQAEQQDLEDDAFDLLAASRHLDLTTLIEDEAIMALPAAPRHDGCRAPARPTDPLAPVDAPAPSPFSALGPLRRRGGDPSR